MGWDARVGFVQDKLCLLWFAMVQFPALSGLFVKTALTGPLITLCVMLLGVELYSLLPVRLSNNLKLLPPPALLPDEVTGAKKVAVLFPGYGGVDSNTDRIIEEAKKEGVTAICYDWETYRGNLVRAANNGISLGSMLGKQLAASEKIEEVHFIGVSVGSFAANACLEAFASEVEKQKRGGQRKKFQSILQTPESMSSEDDKSEQLPMTRATFLDPFTQKGLFGLGYGIKRFGLRAQYAEQYLNTDDPVPSTNEACNHCAVFDITACKDRDEFIPLPQDNMHSWPAAFYGMNYHSGRKIGPTLASRSHSLYPRGRVSFVA